jgi:hypothetical protein
MKPVRAVVFAVGAAVLVAANAVSASAQARSSLRIPISKEGQATVRVDTVTVTIYKTDTLRLQGRVDTLRLQGRTDTVTRTLTRVDTIFRAPPPAPIRLPTGFYLGAGGGVYAPAGSLFNPNSAGPSGQVQLGWASVTQPWGFRIDGNYAKPGEDALYSQYQADPEVVNLSADLTISLPWFTHALGLSSRFSPYLLAGGSMAMYKNLSIRLDEGLSGGVGPANVAPGSNEWSKNAGWNVGLGGGVMWGRTQIFVESRLIAFDTDNTPMARQFPTIVGINIF